MIVSLNGIVAECSVTRQKVKTQAIERSKRPNFSMHFVKQQLHTFLEYDESKFALVLQVGSGFVASPTKLCACHFAILQHPQVHCLVQLISVGPILFVETY